MTFGTNSSGKSHGSICWRRKVYIAYDIQYQVSLVSYRVRVTPRWNTSVSNLLGRLFHRGAILPVNPLVRVDPLASLFDRVVHSLFVLQPS